MKVDKYWLRPQPGDPVSGPYTEEEARERFEGGAVMWPEQQAYIGPSKRDLHPVEFTPDGPRDDDAEMGARLIALRWD